ncbi:Imidazole glycerol phosphate synthase hisHF, chloroplastic [Dendrobium catenatum]|uniref:Imidazole glycerol phosphate synthase hisHF, chloroplastic n=1 Tax=Dendrobium catenatum TaxID=906689 RepID=A0A2I0WJS3_9ASPA|nr:Imidazole glycerol phosphate synthase hisHF, chloroplastic [Dendrobium catenatum]
MEAPAFSSTSRYRLLPCRPLSRGYAAWSPGKPYFERRISLSVRAFSEDSTVTLLDYGAGNVRSVRNAIRHLGFDVKYCGIQGFLWTRVLLWSVAPNMDFLFLYM